MNHIQKNLTIDTSRILEEIVNSKKLGESFIPEIDGRKLLKEILPIEQAIAAGKDSELYREVTLAYRKIMREMFKIQKYAGKGGVFAVIKEPITLDYYDNRRDRFENGELVKYNNTFGRYYSE